MFHVRRFVVFCNNFVLNVLNTNYIVFDALKFIWILNFNFLFYYCVVKILDSYMALKLMWFIRGVFCWSYLLVLLKAALGSQTYNAS